MKEFSRLWNLTKTPMKYFSAYIGIIIAFTGVFVLIGPRNFYDSAVIHEDIFPEERREFNAFLGDLVVRGANSSAGPSDRDPLVQLRIHPYQIRSRELKDGVVSGFLIYVFTDYSKPGQNFYCDFDFEFDTTQIWQSTYDRGSSSDHLYAMMWPTSHKYAGVGRLGVCDTDRDLLTMFPEGETKFGPKYPTSREKPIYLPLNGRDKEELTKFGLAFKGDPYYLKHDIQRMFYFSATTITTVGFGDILPISETARVLSGIEAILGWIVAGLFINAVTRERTNKSVAGASGAD